MRFKKKTTIGAVLASVYLGAILLFLIFCSFLSACEVGIILFTLPWSAFGKYLLNITSPGLMQYAAIAVNTITLYGIGGIIDGYQAKKSEKEELTSQDIFQ